MRNPAKFSFAQIAPITRYKPKGAHAGGAFNAISVVVEASLDLVESVLLVLPGPVMAAAIVALVLWRQCARMPANTATLIRSKIEAYAQDPCSQANKVKSLKGREAIRLHVRDWRVIMGDQGNVLAVLDIGPQGGIYG